MYSLVPFRSRFDRDLSRQLNSMFDDSFFRSFFNMNDAVGNAGFRVDIKDKENEYVLEAELPGVPEDQIKLSVENDVLTISADNKAEKCEGEYYCERRFGHAERRFNLENIVQEQIGAAYKNGILYVTLPKAKPEPKKVPRSIPINLAEVKDSGKLEVGGK